MKVAVAGASGFAGTAIVERLESRGIEVIPLIRGAGSAWRLARTGRALTMMDALDPASVRQALHGATHVINCTRGDRDVMLRGLKNLLRESRAAGVLRFVHLSSVAVYGDPPGADSVTEDGATLPAADTYGALKLEQDRLVEAEARRGVPAVILCPPNISGPYSYFLLQVLQSRVSGRFAFVAGGDAPCNLVDVHNLAYAAELALTCEAADARRIFVTDDDPVTWRNVVDALMPLLHGSARPESVTADEVRRATVIRSAKTGLLRSLAHLVSGDVRAAVRRDPHWAKLELALKKIALSAPLSLQKRLRAVAVGPTPVRKVTSGADLDWRLVAQQLRGVRHSGGRAREVLGYAPIVGFDQSMTAFRRWYGQLCSLESPGLSLLAQMIR
jgi:nucleoside-diphosphate-sugar epimerase